MATRARLVAVGRRRVRAVIVVAGIANVQFSVPVEGFPLEYAPVRYLQGRTGVSVGGVGFNVAAGLAALGGAVAGELRARGLDGPWVAGGQETPRSVLLHEPGGERMIHTDLRGLPEAVYPAGVFADAVRGAAYAVVTNIGFARPLLGTAHDAGVPVAADVQAIDDTGCGSGVRGSRGWAGGAGDGAGRGGCGGRAAGSGRWPPRRTRPGRRQAGPPVPPA